MAIGFIEAFKGAVGGTLGDQWRDFYTVPTDFPGTVGLVPAVPSSQNAGRGANLKGSDNIITNGSKLIVPEGYGLVTIENGAITGFVSQAGGYEFRSDDVNAKTFIGGDGMFDSLLKQAIERASFGGRPGSEHLAFYVNLKEIPGNKFGTRTEIYWFDSFLNTQVGALTHGSYSLRIVDPLLFIKNFVPASFISAGAEIFDFADTNNSATDQLFNEVIACLSSAMSKFTNDPDKENSIRNIQQGSALFATSLSAAVEENYQWRSARGLEIVSAALLNITYDEDTKALLTEVKRADALMGARGNSFLQQSVARGIQAAGSNPSGGGAMGMAFMGMGLNAAGGMAQGLQQPVAAAAAPTADASAYLFDPMTGQPINAAATTGVGVANATAAGVGAANATAAGVSPQATSTATTAAQAQAPLSTGIADTTPTEDPYEKLTKLKGLLDNGVITQADFDASKAKLLGI
ncbi:MAG: SPFH domain-containing protein [Coriobacteriales bacterium]|jgi:membrane protease subunit (stomatin/prohibitin family)|nr:SPFH domain-containing protein [Coriobacteriales bacterium]